MHMFKLSYFCSNDERSQILSYSRNVLVTGGVNNINSPFNSIELYNSSTETYTSIDIINDAQSFHKILTLINRKLLVSGENNGTAFDNE